MASLSLFKRSSPALARYSNGRALVPGVFSIVGSRTIETHSTNNPGVVSSDGMMGSPNPGENASDSSGFNSNSANQSANYTVGRTMSEKAEELTERAKQTAQDLWGAAKETVVGAAEDTKESLKENAERVERGMNSKN
ncbi:hypothetical protein MLD38_039755 [Melastoma candidum]|uniref:Uncharacterized protein n=1 Tax=Melastoma candidum TaxID=119954 RepID=A0ACB9L355_9MYRT|nr:hypothetical protein MLD38_039755 [Melastoma candidum]